MGPSGKSGRTELRITMIHALPESIPPTRLAFQDVFPEAELVNFLDEGLFIDFQDHLTARLRRRMCQVICYCAEHGADAIGLACSVYTPVVEMASTLVDVPVVSSYGPVVKEALAAGARIGILASVPATLRDAEIYLQETAREHNKSVEVRPCLAEDLITVLRTEGEVAFHRRLAEEVQELASAVEVVLLSQFSMASALSHLRTVSPVPVLSAPHSSASYLKQLVLAPKERIHGERG